VSSYLAHQVAAARDLNTFGENVWDYPLGGTVAEGLGVRVGEGLLLLERRLLNPREEAWVVCGAEPAEYGGSPVAEVKNNTTFVHVADQSYHYRARHVEGNGQIDLEPGPIVRLDFDSGGSFLDNTLPHRPLNLVATALIDTGFKIDFSVDPMMPGGTPYRFRLYGGTVAGGMDWGTPLTDPVTTLAYQEWNGVAGRHTFRSPINYSVATAIMFGMRASNSDDEEEQNEYTTPPVYPAGSALQLYDYALDDWKLDSPRCP